MAYKLFLDDLRDYKQYYPINSMIVARNYHEAVEIVLKNGLPEFVSFDHDLADYLDGSEKTGYDFAKFLVDIMMDMETPPIIDYVVHSANPVGKTNIETYLNNFYDFVKNQ